MQNFTSFGPVDVVLSEQISWKKQSKRDNWDILYENFVRVPFSLSLSDQKIFLAQKI